MDFGLREWLLILGPLFIIIVLVHGYFRMRANRNTLKMKLDKSYLSKPGQSAEDVERDEIARLKAELPNGGARVRKVPEQANLDLKDDIPVLMEPVEMGRREEEPAELELPDIPISAKPDDEEPEAPPRPEPPVLDVRQPRETKEKPEHFVVLYVSALGEPFDGQALLEALVEQGMQFGEMDIFHRLDDDGQPMFSLVNAVEPGTFDIADMAVTATPAVSLFLRAHEVAEPLAAYNEMVEVARALADELGGEVKDSSRSVLTPQTIEHCREEIRAYQHRYS